MLLGINETLPHTSPADWAKKHKELGVGTVVFPLNCQAPLEMIDAYAAAAKEAGLVIAEVGVWRNTLAADLEEREKMIQYAIGQLKLADRIGARCCVNIIGTPYGPRWDGAYAGNFSAEYWEMAVKMIQRIIDEAKPSRTKYSIEPMAWMMPTGPDEYLQLIKDVDREAFGVHMDLINMIDSPRRYFGADAFMEECFGKLKGHICSCHLKDSLLLEPFTVHLQECACGKGTINLEKYAELASIEDPTMPMLIEHLSGAEEYIESFAYVNERLKAYVK